MCGCEGIQFGRDIEDHVYNKLVSLGYAAERQGANHPYDILLNGKLKIEVKGARYHRTRNGKGRYQATYHNDADVLIIVLATGKGARYLVIPCASMPEQNLAIWRKDAEKYTGLWAFYLERWDKIGDLLFDTPPPAQQMALF